MLTDALTIDRLSLVEDNEPAGTSTSLLDKTCETSKSSAGTLPTLSAELEDEFSPHEQVSNRTPASHGIMFSFEFISLFTDLILSDYALYV